MSPKNAGDPDEITGQSALPSTSQILFPGNVEIAHGYTSFSHQENYPAGRRHRTMLQ